MGCTPICEIRYDSSSRKSKIDYTQLLKAASAAEIESERGRAMGLHSKASLLNSNRRG